MKPTHGLPARAPGTTTAFSRERERHAGALAAGLPPTSTCTCSAGTATWCSADLASGGTGTLNGETMSTGRLSPGRYRIEVHNWVGLPGTSVALRLTFYDRAFRA